MDYKDVNFCGKGAPVDIGSHSWICSRSIILPGVSIGEGAIVASGGNEVLMVLCGKIDGYQL